MSGHSHWKTIKRAKDIEDKKKSKIFSKLSQEISVIAKEGGDPESNSSLRVSIEKAKRFNMPKEKIDRAIKKGTGELSGVELRSIFIDAYGPFGIAIIIEGVADNKNRFLLEIKQILNENNGKMVNEGGVQWLFERKVDSEINSLTWVAKQTIKISEKENLACQKLFKALNENESVQEIYHNITRN